MKIGVDIDGVLFPYAEQFRNFCQIKLKKNLPKIVKWHFYRDWGLSDDQYFALQKSFINSLGFEIGKPYYYAKSAIDNLRANNHEIAIITHRIFHDFDLKLKKEIINSTINWLYKYEINFDYIIFIKDKSNMGLDILIDDATHNLEEFKNIKICFSQPWNKDYKGFKLENWTQIDQYFYLKQFNH